MDEGGIYTCTHCKEEFVGPRKEGVTSGSARELIDHVVNNHGVADVGPAEVSEFIEEHYTYRSNK